MQDNISTKSNLFGAILLIAGCCIGAGMLGLPVLTALAGFVPSAILFVLCWLFMVCTGLLVLEVNLWFAEETNVVSMAERTLGSIGKTIAWSTFAFLFYSLLVAYVSASGELAVSFFLEFTGIQIPNWIGSIFCAFLLGLFTYLGTRPVDHLNRLLMFGLLSTYALLIIIGSRHVNTTFLQHKDWAFSLLGIPAMIVSFGYHNLVPSLTTYLKRNVRHLQIAIIVGSAIPLLVYLIWESLILGLIPIAEFRDALQRGDIATEALRRAEGSTWVVDVAQYFAFFAIVTSFIGVALSFVDFLADALKVKKTINGRVLLSALALVPPLFFSIVYPNIFLTALTLAGSFGALILFGILPAAMVWSGRYHKNLADRPLVPGGKPLLIFIMVVSTLVILLQFIQKG